MYGFKKQCLVLGSPPERDQLVGAIARRAGSAIHVSAEPQSPERLEQPVFVIRCCCDIVRALIDLLDLWALDALEDQDSGSILQKDRKFTPAAVLSGSQEMRFCKRGFEVCDCLSIGRAGGGAIAGTLVAKAGLIGETGAAEMMGQDFRLRLRQHGKSLFQSERAPAGGF
jgi:hypothetical protein